MDRKYVAVYLKLFSKFHSTLLVISTAGELNRSGTSTNEAKKSGFLGTGSSCAMLTETGQQECEPVFAC